jgi:hypothetical protein
MVMFFEGVGVSIFGWPNNLREEPSQANATHLHFAAQADI